MKKILTIFASVVLCTAAQAQSVNLHLKNGSTVYYSDKDVEYVDFNETMAAPSGTRAVDLGLPSKVKWATHNIGAVNPWDKGQFFAWGETKGSEWPEEHNFWWDNYKWCSGTSTTLTKYCSGQAYGKVDNKTALENADDAAKQNWGGNWRMPTVAECNELIDHTDNYYSFYNSIPGRWFVHKEKKDSVFIPAIGVRYQNEQGEVGRFGAYWSSEKQGSAPEYAYGLFFAGENAADWKFYRAELRCYGLPIRPVQK